MPRVSKEQNRKDIQKIMKLLIAHPNLDVDTISQQSGLSNQQVYKILRNLEEEKILFGNPRLIDLPKANRKRFIIFAKRSGSLANDRTLKCALYSKEFLTMLAKEKIEIIPEDDFTCSGEYDMVTIINAESTLQANKYVDFLRSISYDYFSKFSIIEVMFTTKRNSIPTPDVERFTNYVSEVSSYQNSNSSE
jgi:DNA-binding Lrp family transcriptional regulator